MTKLLQIDSSGRASDSVTRQLTDIFVSQWTALSPKDEVTRRDLVKTPPAFLDGPRTAALFTPPDQHTPEMKKVAAEQVALVDEFIAADVVVIGAPMYNFSIPAVLKAYIDQIVAPGKTFAYDNGSLTGLMQGKRVVVCTASGSDFDSEPMSRMNFVEPYLRAILGFLGITDVEVIAVRGHNAEQIEAGMKKAMPQIEQLVNRLTDVKPVAVAG